MKLPELIKFRRDLLFNGAVQIGWFETDHNQRKVAAEHFVFHGPGYHGVVETDLGDVGAHRLIDTASFVCHTLENLQDADEKDDPFTVAIAGYGMGKSHLGLTLAALLDAPDGKLAQRIVANLKIADKNIGNKVETILGERNKPYLVVAINGMQDFDLVGEVTRQILLRLEERGQNTAPLEDLRPRFKTAQNFTKSFFATLRSEFTEKLGNKCTQKYVLEQLKHQNEKTFEGVSEIYEQKMGVAIRAIGQESLQEILRVVKQTYCGQDKPFDGMLIIFDEFGRYLEFAVQKPFIAGSGGLQQLFEGVQENGDMISLICLIQYELKAYVSRVAPELRDALNRYVSRYDSVKKVRLSSNLETLIANLLEKRDAKRLKKYIEKCFPEDEIAPLIECFQKWFPDLDQHALWNDPNRFRQIVQEGCWPLHPAATWFLYRMSAVGKSLQQRSALAFLDDAFETYKNVKLPSDGWSIPATDLCTEAMVSEFLSSEQYGQQGAVAHAYETVFHRYQHEISPIEKSQLQAILLASKIGLHVESQEDCTKALAMLSGQSIDDVNDALKKLTKEYGVLEWNEHINQYELIGDAVPRRAFVKFLRAKISEIKADYRAELFAQNIKRWCFLDSLETDFGTSNNISTTEWQYAITCSNLSLLESHVQYAIRAWHDAIDVDQPKGHLIYCYVGPESDVEKARKKVETCISKNMKALGLTRKTSAPIAIILLHDNEGKLGDRIAEYCVLNEQIVGEDAEKFANFILDRKNRVQEEVLNEFRVLERTRDLTLICDKDVSGRRIKTILTELFSVVYNKCIPFPFDGFHTARGNAAKDCHVFTTELFTGNLNQKWIAARNVQQRNRSAEVLHESWQALARDGSVQVRPGTQNVRRIVQLFDNTIKSEGRLNLGKVIRQLCWPPFGCNIASAGMVLV